MTQERETQRTSPLVKTSWKASAPPKPERVDLSEDSSWSTVYASFVGGWRALRQRPVLAAWAACAQGVVSVLQWLPWVVLVFGALRVVAPFLSGMGTLPTQTLGVFENQARLARGLRALGALLEWLTSAQVVAGSLGLFLVVFLAAFCVRVLVESGVLGVVGRSVVPHAWEREEEDGQGGFLRRLGARVGALGWMRVLGSVALWSGGVLTVVLSLGALRTVAALGWFGPDAAWSGVLASACVVALCGTLGLGVCGVLWVVFEQATAALYTDRELAWWDAFWSSVERVGRYPGETLGLGAVLALVYAAGLCVHLLGLGLVRSVEHVSTAAGGVLGVTWDLVTLGCAAAFWVWCRGVWLVYVALRSKRTSVLPCVVEREERVLSAQQEAHVRALLPAPQQGHVDASLDEEDTPTGLFVSGGRLVVEPTVRNVVDWEDIQAALKPPF